MPQQEVGDFAQHSLQDFLGWKSAPEVPDPFRARMYYNSDDDTIHIINSDGDELLGGGGAVSSVFGRTGDVAAQNSDYAAFYVDLNPSADQTISGAFALIFNGGALRITPVTFATLPSAVGLEGTLRSVTDSSTATWGATITGGGSNHVLAYSNGSNWTVAGK